VQPLPAWKRVGPIFLGFFACFQHLRLGSAASYIPLGVCARHRCRAATGGDVRIRPTRRTACATGTRSFHVPPGISVSMPHKRRFGPISIFCREHRPLGRAHATPPAPIVSKSYVCSLVLLWFAKFHPLNPLLKTQPPPPLLGSGLPFLVSLLFFSGGQLRVQRVRLYVL
jgi:hypothetical protein